MLFNTVGHTQNQHHILYIYMYLYVRGVDPELSEIYIALDTHSIHIHIHMGDRERARERERKNGVCCVCCCLHVFISICGNAKKNTNDGYKYILYSKITFCSNLTEIKSLNLSMYSMDVWLFGRMTAVAAKKKTTMKGWAVRLYWSMEHLAWRSFLYFQVRHSMIMMDPY